MLSERRTHRSDDTMTALHYQLAFARKEAGFDAVVLADASGCLVAGAGAWPTCEELAAYAPLIARRGSIASEALASRVATVAENATARSLSIDGAEVFLCVRGGGGGAVATLARAAAGCRRILGAEA